VRNLTKQISETSSSESDLSFVTSSSWLNSSIVMNWW
jgi:hypothetical protein